jgi:hypothetical protein
LALVVKCDELIESAERASVATASAQSSALDGGQKNGGGLEDHLHLACCIIGLPDLEPTPAQSRSS